MTTSTIPPCYYRISIKALILDEEKRFLLVKEENGLWDFPGGGMDFGETPDVCIKREILEEMGLRVTRVAINPSYFLTIKGSSGKPGANVLYVTEVENLNFTPSEECIELGFFTIEEAEQLQLYPNIQEFIKLYKLSNHGNF